jgi:molybdate/tungstate transport system substrate-binding protein
MLPFAADTVVLFIAASLVKPLQPALDDYAARSHTVIQVESGATLEHVRKITELHRTPDLLLLADADVFPRFLVPKYSSWFAEFARNRMVVAYTDRSRHAKDITAANWMKVLAGGDVEVGRTDPNLAPVGYRTLLMFDLAEKHYRMPGLARSLLAHAPEKNIRPNAAALAGLLAAGELDFIYDYQSVAESNGFRFIQLPPEIDLGDPDRAALYETVSVRVRGTSPGSTTTFEGQPILYGATIPAAAPHPKAAQALYRHLTSPAVIAQLRTAHVDMLDRPVIVGTGAPR